MREDVKIGDWITTRSGQSPAQVVWIAPNGGVFVEGDNSFTYGGQTLRDYFSTKVFDPYKRYKMLYYFTVISSEPIRLEDLL